MKREIVQPLNSKNSGIKYLQHEVKQHHIYVVDYLLHGSLRVINLHTIFKVRNISYLRVLFHSSWLLLTFWDTSHKKGSKEKIAFMLQYQHRVLNMRRRTVQKRRRSLTFDFVIEYQIMFTYTHIIFL